MMLMNSESSIPMQVMIKMLADGVVLLVKAIQELIGGLSKCIHKKNFYYYTNIIKCLRNDLSTVFPL